MTVSYDEDVGERITVQGAGPDKTLSVRITFDLRNMCGRLLASVDGCGSRR